MKTIFERILSREVPADIVYEDESVLAFRDIAPQAPVHILVIPKRKWTSFADLASADPLAIGAYFAAVAQVAKHVGLEANGYRVVFNHGEDGQQTVAYIHAHILGGRPLHWPPG